MVLRPCNHKDKKLDKDYITLEEIENNIQKNLESIQKNVRDKDLIPYANIDGVSTINLMKNEIKQKPKKIKNAFSNSSPYRQDWKNRKATVFRNKLEDISELPMRNSQNINEKIAQEYPISKEQIFSTLHNFYGIKLSESTFKFYIREGLIEHGYKIIEQGILGSRSSYKNKTIELIVIIDYFRNKFNLSFKEIKYYFRIINFQESGILNTIIMWEKLQYWPIYIDEPDPNFQKKIKKIKENYIQARKMYWGIYRVILFNALAELVSRENDLRDYLKWENFKKIKFHLSFDEVFFSLHLKAPINRTINISEEKIKIFKLKP